MISNYRVMNIENTEINGDSEKGIVYGIGNYEGANCIAKNMKINVNSVERTIYNRSNELWNLESCKSTNKG